MLATLLCISALTVGISAPDTDQVPIPLKRQAQLHHLVKQDCGSCHGMTLKGGLGTPLQPQDLTGKSIDFLTFTIINGRPNTAMPPWQEILSQQEARWIAQQLKRGTFNAQ